MVREGDRACVNGWCFLRFGRALDLLRCGLRRLLRGGVLGWLIVLGLVE